MKTIAVRELLKKIKPCLDEAQEDRVVITRRGKPAAVLIGVEGQDWETVILETDPADYPWSCYQWHGLGTKGSEIRDHPLYLALGRTDHGRHVAYRELFRDALDQAIVQQIREGGNQCRV